MINTYLKYILGALLGITLIVLACVLITGGSMTTINLTLIWGYMLVAAAIGSAIFCAVYGMKMSPGGAKKSLYSVLGIVGIVVISLIYASTHTILIPNIETGGVFETGETVITEVSVIVAYILGAGAVIAAIASEVINALK